MIPESKSIVSRLRAVADRIVLYIQSQKILDERRYARSTEDLISLNIKRLDTAISENDDKMILWQFRSVSDMMKGVIDISSSWLEQDKDGNAELLSIANDAHALEKKYRGEFELIILSDQL